MLKFKPGYPGTSRDKGERKGKGWVRSVKWGKEAPLQSPQRGLRHPSLEQAAGLGGETGQGPACVIVWSNWSRRSLCTRLQMDPGWCLFDKGLLAVCWPAVPGNQPISKFLNNPDSCHFANELNIPTQTLNPGAPDTT